MSFSKSLYVLEQQTHVLQCQNRLHISATQIKTITQTKTNPTKITETPPPPKKRCLHSNSGSRHRAVLTPRLQECKQSCVCLSVPLCFSSIPMVWRCRRCPDRPCAPRGQQPLPRPGTREPLSPGTIPPTAHTGWDRKRTSPDTALVPAAAAGRDLPAGIRGCRAAPQLGIPSQGAHETLNVLHALQESSGPTRNAVELIQCCNTSSQTLLV